MTGERPSIKLFAAAMIRNENDIILPFLRQCASLFDQLLVADIQSTDGTATVVRRFADPRLKIQVYQVNRQEKYQSALMNCLSREAFARGADWVFFLDADEFIDVQNRVELERYLQDVGSDMLMGPWINLVPTKYGNYNTFDPTQDFYWSGRSSKFAKVALSSLFAANHPDYHIHEGNHLVAPSPTAPPIWERPGLPLLHVPIRSLDRLKFKIGSARRLTEAKHNRGLGEGSHVDELDELLSIGSVEHAELNYIAANYGERIGQNQPLLPGELGWPVKRLPPYIADGESSAPGLSLQLARLSETLCADAQTVWDQTIFVNGTAVGAVIEGEHLRIVPQPMLGSGRARNGRYPALGPVAVTGRPWEEMLVDVVSISCMRVEAWAFSAWSELVPVMYALFTLLRPRRFVELGVHNGMSFFAACQAAERLALSTDCVAVDTWLGDEHAGIHEPAVFDEFRAYLRHNYPHQQYIQAYFSAARGCFEDGSIDLLHIDGLHTYEAVKEDFETWLPKLSDVGVIILHDINVFERRFGVWRLWQELKAKYPAYGFAHQHGLGIVFVGREPHPFASLLRSVAENHHYGTIAQAYFEAVGTLLIEHRRNLAALEEATQGRTALKPLRSLKGAPRLPRWVRKAAKLARWTVTGQLPRRLRKRRKRASRT
jgi:hypothetical protein